MDAAADRPSGKGASRAVTLAYDAAAARGDKAARDVFDQLEAIERALRENGDRPVRLPVDLDLRRFRARVSTLGTEVVFNLVESLDLSDRLQAIVPLVLEDGGIAFTGSGSRAMLLANHKIAAKRALADRGLPTPACAWLEADGSVRFLPPEAEGGVASGRWIVKALDSHASLHLDDASVRAFAGAGELAAVLREISEKHGVPYFAERYAGGREFNLSLLAKAEGGVEVLPASEIVFVDFPEGKPRIVGHDAKWEEDSAEWKATPQRFVTDPADAALARKLGELAVAVWNAMGLAGYARVDFRTDEAGNPLVLEANANPCLSPGAGFAIAAERAGLGYAAMCERIVAAARPAR